MLIRNLSDTLVNGLRGVVKKLDTDSIEVKFLINEKLVLLVFQERYLQYLSHNQLHVLVVSFLEIYVWLYHSKLLRETGLSLQ
jgi:hypothetical protein